MRRYWGLLPYIGLTSFIFIGFLCHRSAQPFIGLYSLPYIGFLGGLLVGFVGMPLLFLKLIRTYGRKQLLFSMLPACALVFVLYLGAHYYYYASRTHPFHPYTQISPPAFDSIRKYPPPNTLRILTLGGSTTACNDLPPEERYPHLLQSHLQSAYPDLQIEVLNGAMDWYTSRHSLINYLTVYRDFRPHIVVVMHGINDICRSFSPPQLAIGEYKSDYSHYYGPAAYAAIPPTFERQLLRPFYRPPLSYWFDLFDQETDYPMDVYQSQEAFQKNLLALGQFIQRDSSHYILIGQPSLYKDSLTQDEYAHIQFGRQLCYSPINPINIRYPSPHSLGNAMRTYHSITKMVALHTNARYFPANQQLPKTLAYFSDDVHYTPKGAQTLATYIAEQLIGTQLIPRISQSLVRPSPSHSPETSQGY